MKNRNNWSGFFANLLGIILGILLTLGANSLWQKHEEKKKTKEMLVLVRNELEINRKWFKDQKTFIQKDCRVYKKIIESKNNLDDIPIDTLKTYLYQLIIIQFEPLFSSAWQIFQNSDIIQKIDNKELIIRLTECYFWIDKIQKHIEKEYWNKKMEVLLSDFIAEHPAQYLNAVMNNNKAVAFYTAMTKEFSPFWDLFPYIDAVIDYNLLLLDKYGDFQYNMTEKDKEYETFINTKVNAELQKNDTLNKSEIFK